MADNSKYGAMRHRFNAVDFLMDVVSHKGVLYPGMFINWMGYDKQGYPGARSDFEQFDSMPESPRLRTETTSGTPIRIQDPATGRYYFMPLWIDEIEFPCAAISISGKKRIVETSLTGRRGSVIELAGVDSYEISITTILVGDDGNYPEDMVATLRELYERNESLEIVSALTDLVFQDEDKVVIKSIEFPPVGAVENVQIVKMTAQTDAAIELIIE